jgi:hypothetical protein
MMVFLKKNAEYMPSVDEVVAELKARAVIRRAAAKEKRAAAKASGSGAAKAVSPSPSSSSPPPSDAEDPLMWLASSEDLVLTMDQVEGLADAAMTRMRTSDAAMTRRRSWKRRTPIRTSGTLG